MYNDIVALDAGQGDNIGGICSFKFVPREWLAAPVELDIVTGTVPAAPALIGGKSWIDASCMDDTMEYAEKAKTDGGGNYVEATLTGVAYRHEIARHTNIATLHYHEVVVIYTDANNTRRIIGDRAKAMSFTADNTTGKGPQDAEMYMISLTHKMAEAAPIYAGV